MNTSKKRSQRLRREGTAPVFQVQAAGSDAQTASARVETPAPAHLTLLIDAAGRIHAVQDALAGVMLNCPAPALFGASITRWLRRAALPPDHGNASGGGGPLVSFLLAAASETGPAAMPCEWLCDQRTGSSPMLAWVNAERLQTDVGLRLLVHISRRTLQAAELDHDLPPVVFSQDDHLLAVTLDSITVAVVTTDSHGSITYLNAAAEELIGCPLSEIAGFPVEEVYRRAGAQARRQIDNPVRAVLQTGLRVSPRDTAQLAGDPAADRPTRVIADNAAPINDPGDEAGQLRGVVLVLHDITDRHRAAEELQKAGRIESLGLLAGGIAHDFNNLLTSVLGNLSVARSSGGNYPSPHDAARPALPPAVVEAIDRAERACSRARELTNQLLTFAKGGDPVRKTVELPAPIEQAVHFALTGSSVRADIRFDADLATVEADEGQLVQVFHNLALNAAQAMAAEGGTLEVRGINARGHPGGASPPLPPGDYVVLTVRDHGCGISAEHMSKIFDPFFTTKANGTGLGLATTYSIIKKHDGAVIVESEPGVGTEFTIFLPANPAATAHAAHETTPELPTARPAPGLRVLFMDDDPDIRELIGAILALLGYEVTLTCDGAAAIKEYETALACGRRFAVVILDLTIPGGMGGKETVRRLREIDPKVRAVVSSGYSNDTVVSDFRQAGFVGMVAKPYRMEDLARVLNEVIEAP
ncbi:MAG: response regulator [Verrucomicrobia bacterium]|nr:response regulator [Verrucomicrobiota bacterium]